MNNILSAKRNSAIFLAIVLVTGTIATLSSLTVGAQAQPYYNSYEPPQHPSYKPDYKAKYPSDNNNYKSKDNSKSVSINKLKCINNNVNINGNNTGDVNIANKGQGYLGANSYGGGYYDGYDNKQDKGFDCIINNNNTNTNIGGGGNQTIPPDDDDDDERTTLTVIKNVVCNDPLGTQCPTLTVESSDFAIKVDGAGGSTETQPGAPAPGTPYQLNAGSYTITEAIPFPPPTGFTLSTSFSGGAAGCVQDQMNVLKATGTIVAGVDQSCTITNTYTPFPGPGP